MRRVWIVLSLAACTQPNPLFGDRPGGTSDTSTSATEDTTTKPPGDTSITTTASNDTTGEATITTDSEPSTDSTEDDTVGTETGEVCALPEGAGLTIEIDVVVPTDPDCMGVWMSAQGPIGVERNSITVAECGCPCAFEPVPDATIAIDGVEIPALPECGRVVAWLRPFEGGCVWGGVAVFDASPPSWIASSTIGVPPAVFGGLEMSFKPDDPCSSVNCPDTGSYELVFENTEGDNAIRIDEDPKVMTLPFFAALPYLVDNVSAVIDAECRPQIAWTALNQ